MIINMSRFGFILIRYEIAVLLIVYCFLLAATQEA